MNTTFSGLQKAVQRVGDVPRFAAAIGVTQAIVLTWLKEDGTPIPPEIRPPNSGIRKAVDKARGAYAMARDLGVSGQAVGTWLKQGYVPQGRAVEIENLYGISRAELVSPKVRNMMGVGGEL
jgi:DNA-binding transcriptional regulator YdaS (Cro superfamily)